MNPRHAISLTLLGWYLMIPPYKPVGESRQYIVHSAAPLGHWTKMKSFESRRGCEGYKQRLLEWAKANPQHYRSAPMRGFEDAVHQSQCVAKDDPRVR
jgi:hypothetical protein